MAAPESAVIKPPTNKVGPQAQRNTFPAQDPDSFTKNSPSWVRGWSLMRLGTTISPHLFFWQASQEAEEVQVGPEEKPLRRAPAPANKQLRRIRIDTYAGMAVSNAVAFFIMLTAAATLRAPGDTAIQTATQAASALEPLSGRFAYALFAAGIIVTDFDPIRSLFNDPESKNHGTFTLPLSLPIVGWIGTIAMFGASLAFLIATLK